jgi:Amt family ammonium transporter
MSMLLALFSIMLVPFAAAGLALIQQGLGRSRSAAHAMLATLCAMAIAAIIFVLLGASFAGFSGGLSHSFRLGGVNWDWLGGERSPARSGFGGSYAAVCLQMFAAGIAAIIPISAGSDRWRLGAICASTAVLAGFIFPMFSHWVWGGGWLAQLEVNFGPAALGTTPFIDTGGAAVIQVIGGLSALSVAWILGARRGKYSEGGIAAAIPGHNIVQVLFGCLLALVGWIGLESAVWLLFYNAAPQQIALVVINAMLSASAGCLASVVTTRIRYRKPDASLGANGWVSGLVAGSAAGAMVSPAVAILTGLVAGVLVTLLIEIFELRLLIDDPGGAISVHAGAGLWGLIAAGLFIHSPERSHAAHLLAQLIGAATLIGFFLPLIHTVNLLLNRLLPFRIDADGDWQGMDVRELGAGAYPEFVVHADEFLPR